jgi:hypothetical protein
MPGRSQPTSYWVALAAYGQGKLDNKETRFCVVVVYQ